MSATNKRVLPDLATLQAKLAELEARNKELEAKASGSIILEVIDYVPSKGKNAGKADRRVRVSGNGIYPLLLNQKTAKALREALGNTVYRDRFQSYCETGE